MKIKKHTTVMITVDTLRKIWACESGINDASTFLPAKLSTDPEQNLDLAIEIAALHNDSPPQVGWLRDAVVNDGDCYCEYCLGGLYAGSKNQDVNIISQELAMVADVIATKAGR